MLRSCSAFLWRELKVGIDLAFEAVEERSPSRECVLARVNLGMKRVSADAGSDGT
jgi:hypothetical protein